MLRHVTLRRALTILLLLPCAAAAQSLQPPYDGDYSIVDLGPVPGVPPNYGGLTFLAGDSNTLLVAGGANGSDGAIYSIGVVRDMDGHITGYSGTAALWSEAAYNDGGLAYGPGGVLFYTRYSANEIGQIKPGSVATDKIVSLTALGVASSTGGLNFVPAGFPGAGNLKVTSYNGAQWYELPLTADGSGTYDLGTVTSTVGGFPSTLEGFVYVPTGSPQFATDTVLLCEYGTGSIGAYEVDSNGDVVPATRASFITGLTGAEGAVIDNSTGDFLFSTFGGGNRIIAVRGFAAVPTSTTTSTTLAPTTTTTITTTTTLPPDCPATPLDACRTPTQPGKSVLVVKKGKTADKNGLVWKWGSGAATTASDFGDPLTTSEYRLCLYDSSVAAQPLLTAIAPAGGNCDGKPCWKQTAKGFVYKDAAMTPDGIAVLGLKSGEAGKAKILVKAKGADLGVPGLPLATPVTMQLHRSDGGPCFEATFTTPSRNDDRVFKSKSQ